MVLKKNRIVKWTDKVLNKDVSRRMDGEKINPDYNTPLGSNWTEHILRSNPITQCQEG